MKPGGSSDHLFALGASTLDLRGRRLLRDGGEVRVEPKVLDLLVFLTEHRGEAVSKEKIREAIWPNVAVTADSLKRLVKEARRALGESARDSQVIETLRGWGYRLKAEPLAAEGAAAGARPYVGRERLLARAASFLGEAAEFGCRVLLLVGDPGIGKTRTALELGERVRRSGSRFARARSQPTSGVPAYWPWSEILRQLLEDADPDQRAGWLAGPGADAVQLVPELAAGLDSPPAPSLRDAEGARFRLFEAVRRVLRRVAGEAPLLLLLDDLHGADAGSLMLLEFLASELGDVPVSIVATCREPELRREPAHARSVERLASGPGVERLALGGLESAEIDRFVQLRMPGEAPSDLVAALERATRGNPLLMGEILNFLEGSGDLDEAAGADWSARIPRGAEHVIGRRLGQVAPSTQAVLRLASVLGESFDRGTLAGLVAENGEDGDGLAEALTSGLLVEESGGRERLRFCHALIRESLYDGLDPALRVRLHRRVAHHLDATLGASRGERLGELAHHLCEAAPSGDAARAVEAAQAAGDRARELQAMEEAVGHYRRALGALPFDPAAGDRRRCALHLALGEAEVSAEGLPEARRSFQRAAELARELDDPELLARAALGYADRPDAVGASDPLVVSLLEEALEALGERDDPLRTRVLSRLGVELRYDEPHSRAERLIESAVVSARRHGDLRALAQTLDDRSYVAFAAGDPDGWLALNGEIVRVAREAGDPELELAGVKGRIAGFLERGDLAGMDAEIRRCWGIAEVLRTPYARWLARVAETTRALLEGRFARAESLSRAALVDGARVGSGDAEVQIGIQTYYLKLERGELAHLEDAVRAYVQRFPAATAWRAALALLHLECGRPAQARELLESALTRGLSRVPRDRGWLATLALFGLVCEALGEADAAREIHRRLLPFERVHVVVGSAMLYFGSVSLYLGRLATTFGDWDAAQTQLAAAARVHAELGARPMAAHTAHATARLLLARGAAGDRPRAAELLDASLAGAAELGMGALEAVARERRAQL